MKRDGPRRTHGDESQANSARRLWRTLERAAATLLSQSVQSRQECRHCTLEGAPQAKLINTADVQALLVLVEELRFDPVARRP